MYYKFFFSAFIGCVCSIKATSQVNLQKGSFETSISIYGFKDPLSDLSLNLSLDYSSGNGVHVDEMPSCVGQGWNLGGIGVITRIQRGLPDDQVERGGGPSDLNKYPPGYLFNSNSVDQGCPLALNYYPIYEHNNQVYRPSNVIGADREVDYFMLSFNGRSIRFVIDKQSNVRVLNDNRVSIHVIFDPELTNYCRTLIQKFVVVDENGLIYEFAQKGDNKLFNYKLENVDLNGGYLPSAWSLYPDDFRLLYLTKNLNNVPNEIPSEQNPYVTNNWYLTKISNSSSSREIRLDYQIENIVMNGALIIDYNYTMRESNLCYCYAPRLSLTTTRPKISIRKPAISKITLADGGTISFSYTTPRYDCPGAKKLDLIRIMPAMSDIEIKYLFTHSYFVKNEIKTPSSYFQEDKWSRLCLLEVNKISKNEVMNMGKFSYYTGHDNVEDIVPPIFIPAKDPWGYYNGDYCGTPVEQLMNGTSVYEFEHHGEFLNAPSTVSRPSIAQRLALFGAEGFGKNFIPVGGFANIAETYVKSNTKIGYAKNGLLKSIKNEFGGNLDIEYEQNQYDEIKPPFSINLLHLPENNKHPGFVGGVHVSKIIRGKEEGDVQPEITEYKYITKDGKSSLWGIEIPSNISYNRSVYRAERKRFQFTYCDYEFTYPGKTQTPSTGQTEFNSDILKSLSYAGYFTSYAVPQILNDLSFDNWQGTLIVILLNIVADILNSCAFESAPYEISETFSHTNVALNFQNSLPFQFKRVEVTNYLNGAENNNGRTVFQFTSPSDENIPLLKPNNFFPYTNEIRAYNWSYGLLKSKEIYNKSGKLIQSVTNNYNLIENRLTSLSTKSCHCTPTFTSSVRNTTWEQISFINSFTPTSLVGDNPNAPVLNVEFYNQSGGRIELTQSTEKIYDKAENAMETITQYEYNPTNFQVSTIRTFPDDDRVIEKKIFYPEYFDIPPSTTSAIPSLVSSNMVNIPIVTETWQTKWGAKELLSYAATDFEKVSNGIKPAIEYRLIANAPIPLAATGTLGPTSILRPIQQIKAVANIVYGVDGNPVQMNNLLSQQVACTIYGYNSQYPIACVSNAERNEVAFTSFEKGESEDWIINNGDLQEQNSLTGKWHLSGNFGLTSPTLPNTKVYTLTFWSSSPSPQVGSLSPVITGPTIEDWTFYKYEIPTGYIMPVQISGSGKIDEVRIYPGNATMNTSSYYPGIGKSSECDDNNRITYYDYDNFGRLIIIRDAQKSILKTYEYRYKVNGN